MILALVSRAVGKRKFTCQELLFLAFSSISDTNICMFMYSASFVIVIMRCIHVSIFKYVSLHFVLVYCIKMRWSWHCNMTKLLARDVLEWVRVCDPSESKIILVSFNIQAFTMIDQDRDGFIGMDDLKDMYSSLGESIVYFVW